MQNTTRPCAWCAVPYEPAPSGTNATYCPACARQYRREYRDGLRPSQVDPHCITCGAGLPARHSKYCSTKCDPSVYAPRGAIQCVVCLVEFTPAGAHVTCSDHCSTERQRERYRRKNRTRRMALRSSAAGKYTLTDVVERDGCRCHLCGKTVNVSLSGMHARGPTIDHLIPVSANGPDVIDNVALAHRSCNIKRGAGGFAQLRLVG